MNSMMINGSQPINQQNNSNNRYVQIANQQNNTLQIPQYTTLPGNNNNYNPSSTQPLQQTYSIPVNNGQSYTSQQQLLQSTIIQNGTSYSSPQIPSSSISSTQVYQPPPPHTFPQSSYPYLPPPPPQPPSTPPQPPPQSHPFQTTTIPIFYTPPQQQQHQQSRQLISPIQQQATQTQPIQQPVFQQPIQQPTQTQPVFQQPIQQPTQTQPIQQPVFQQPIQTQPIQQSIQTQPIQQPPYQQPYQQQPYQQPYQTQILQPIIPLPQYYQQTSTGFINSNSRRSRNRFSRPSRSEIGNIIKILNKFTNYIDHLQKESLINLLKQKKIKKKIPCVIQTIQDIYPDIKSQKFYKVLKKFVKLYKQDKRQIRKYLFTDNERFDDYDELSDNISNLPKEFYITEDSSSECDSSSSSDSDSDSKMKNKKVKHYSNPPSPVNNSSFAPIDLSSSTLRRSITPPPSLSSSMKRSITPPPSSSSSTTTTKIEPKYVKKEEDTEACSVCLEDVPKSQFFISPCKDHHKFCIECAKESFNNNIKEKKLPTCPMNCAYEYTIEDVSKIFEDSIALPYILQGFSSLHDEVFLRGRMVECPREGCHGKGYLDNGDVTEQVQCPKCREFFCPKCQLISHPGFECENVRKFQQQWYEWNIKGRDERRRQKGNVARLTEEAKAKDSRRKREISQRLKELQDDENYKREHCKLCPRCKVPIEKTGGCRDMICGQNYHGGNGQPGCGHHFDYYNDGLDYQPTIDIHLESEDFFKNIPKINNEDHEYACSNCNKRIRGIRFGCLHVIGYYLCEDCESDENIRKNHHHHGEEHIFRIITSPDEF